MFGGLVFFPRNKKESNIITEKHPTQLTQAASLQLPGFGNKCSTIMFPWKRKTKKELNSGE